MDAHFQIQTGIHLLFPHGAAQAQFRHARQMDKGEISSWNFNFYLIWFACGSSQKDFAKFHSYLFRENPVFPDDMFC